MSFTNTADPAGIQALLDTLRKSQAWVDAINSNSTSQDPAPTDVSNLPPTAVPSQPENSTQGALPLTPTSPTPGPSSVAALLSQLQSSRVLPALTTVPPVPPTPVERNCNYIPQELQNNSVHHPPASIASSVQNQSIKLLSFQQSLPHIAKLSEDPEFVDAITSMKRDQETLEKQLWEERQSIKKKHEEKVKVLKMKAQTIGGLTKLEADTMSAKFQKELAMFDQERALRAWEALVTKQQNALEALKVPTMFSTGNQSDMEKQLKVIGVLEGVIKDDT